MRNVICDGNGSPRRNKKAPGPCGWFGERKGDTREMMEARPCPRCGGKTRVVRDPLTGRWL
jgi:hypothetical protein